jgi:transcription-repair coupling factor (superfamily II helicase)
MFPNPAGMVDFISKQAGTSKLRPDHRLVYMRDWPDPDARLKGVLYLLRNLADVAAQAAA